MELVSLEWPRKSVCCEDVPRIKAWKRWAEQLAATKPEEVVDLETRPEVCLRGCDRTWMLSVRWPRPRF